NSFWMVTLKAHILPHHDLQPPGCRGSHYRRFAPVTKSAGQDVFLEYRRHSRMFHQAPPDTLSFVRTKFLCC
ncbi:hypothetical protein OU666_00265, partial [Escherichia coli]|nr:hypothetical protein [Escherichia coli]MDF8432557.1 hypothetical protein [Escherichia coli]